LSLAIVVFPYSLNAFSIQSLHWRNPAARRNGDSQHTLGPRTLRRYACNQGADRNHFDYHAAHRAEGYFRRQLRTDAIAYNVTDNFLDALGATPLPPKSQATSTQLNIIQAID
jgi:hypothetical protein